MKKSKIKFPQILNAADLVGTAAGIVLIGIGLYKIYPPAMYVVIGLILALPKISGKVVK